MYFVVNKTRWNYPRVQDPLAGNGGIVADYALLSIGTLLWKYSGDTKHVFQILVY